MTRIEKEFSRITSAFISIIRVIRVPVNNLPVFIVSSNLNATLCKYYVYLSPLLI
jgi:hypothetical protein